MMNVPTLHEGKRGCGFRQAGCIYLVTGGLGRPCGKLPIPLTTCPTCCEGIKSCRGWTWVDADKLAEGTPCSYAEAECGDCSLKGGIGRAGLLWIGESFYPTPQDWHEEALKMGASRRIKAVPHGFKVGETWVLVAHRKTISAQCEACAGSGRTGAEDGKKGRKCDACKGDGKTYTAAVFHAFQPERVEYVLKGDETEEVLEGIVKRGLTPVKVVPVEDQQELELVEGGKE